MGWSIGYDTNWNRDIGYGVPATCDHPECNAEIDRGLSHVCGGDPYGGDNGCGLFFCGQHLFYHERRGQLCEKCSKHRKRLFTPKPDVAAWIKHKLTDQSWKTWRRENPEDVKRMKEALKKESA